MFGDEYVPDFIGWVVVTTTQWLFAFDLRWLNGVYCVDVKNWTEDGSASTSLHTIVKKISDVSWASVCSDWWAFFVDDQGVIEPSEDHTAEVLNKVYLTTLSHEPYNLLHATRARVWSRAWAGNNLHILGDGIYNNSGTRVAWIEQYEHVAVTEWENHQVICVTVDPLFWDDARVWVDGVVKTFYTSFVTWASPASGGFYLGSRNVVFKYNFEDESVETMEFSIQTFPRATGAVGEPFYYVSGSGMYNWWPEDIIKVNLENNETSTREGLYPHPQFVFPKSGVVYYGSRANPWAVGGIPG